MRTSKIVHPYTFIIVLLFTIAGCKNYKAITLKANTKLPDTYAGDSDTTGIVSLPIKQFFADPYLVKLVDTALAANPDIQMAMQRIEVAAANLKYSKSWLAPTVEFNATAGLERFGDYTLNGVGNYDTNLSPNIRGNQRIPTRPTPDYFVGLRSSWEADIWGKLANQKRGAYNRFLASRAGYKLVVTSLTAEIAMLYYDLLALDYEQDVIERNIVLQQNALELIEIQKMGGRATELAVQQFVAQLKRTQGLKYAIDQQITEAENQLNYLMGGYGKKIDRDTSINTLKLPGLLKAGVPAQLLLNRPDIKEAELQLAAMNADIKAARAAFMPSLNITAYGGYNAFNAAVLFNPASIAFGLVGGLTAPIFNRARIKADYERTVAEGKQAVFNYQKTILNGYQEVMNGLKGIDNYNNYYQLKLQEVAALKNAVSVSNDLFLVGRATYLEVITAQRNVLDAELELANTRKFIFLNAIGLYRSVGGGWQ